MGTESSTLPSTSRWTRTRNVRLCAARKHWALLKANWWLSESGRSIMFTCEQHWYLPAVIRTTFILLIWNMFQNKSHLKDMFISSYMFQYCRQSASSHQIRVLPQQRGSSRGGGTEAGLDERCPVWTRLQARLCWQQQGEGRREKQPPVLILGGYNVFIAQQLPDN